MDTIILKECINTNSFHDGSCNVILDALNLATAGLNHGVHLVHKTFLDKTPLSPKLWKILVMSLKTVNIHH